MAFGRKGWLRCCVVGTVTTSHLISPHAVPSSEELALQYETSPSIVGSFYPQADKVCPLQCGYQLWNVSALTPDYIGKASVKVGFDMSAVGIRIGAVVQLEASLTVSLCGVPWAVTGNPYYNLTWDFTPYIAMSAGQFINDGVFALNQWSNGAVAAQAWAGVARAVGVVVASAVQVIAIAEVNLFILQAGVNKSFIDGSSVSAGGSVRVSVMSDVGEWTEVVRQEPPSMLAVLPGSPPDSDDSLTSDEE